MRKLIWLLIPFVMLFSLCSKGEIAETAGTDYTKAPDFTLKDLTGNTISLSDFKGKVLFINYWATWCPPCRNEIPGFIEMYSQYKDKGMEVIGISLDRLSPNEILEFKEEFKINYPIAMATQEIINDYSPGNAIPATIIIDKKGRIRHKHIGYLDKTTLENYFLKLIEEKQP